MSYLHLFLLLLYLLPSVANATTRYARNGAGGSGCTNGASNYNPATDTCGGGSDLIYLSIGQGATALVGGDTLMIRAGTYDEHVYCGASNNICIASGSEGAPTTLQAYSGETVWVTPTTTVLRAFNLQEPQAYITFDGINIDGGSGGTDRIQYNAYQISETTIDGRTGPHHITVKNAEIKNIQGDAWGHATAIYVGPNSNNNTFQNLTMHDNGDDGSIDSNPGQHIYIGGDNNLVEKCKLYNARGGGMQLYSGYAWQPDNNIIRYNVIYNNCTGAAVACNQPGITLGGGTNNRAYNNIIYDNAIGITFFSGSGHVAYNNTLNDNNKTSGNIGIRVKAVTSSIARNNLIFGSSSPFTQNEGGTLTTSNNICSSSVTGCASTSTTATEWTDAASNDYTLKAGATALNAGTATIISGSLSVLYNGAAPEIGAYEEAVFGSAETTSTTNIRHHVNNNLWPPLTYAGGSCTASSFTVTEDAGPKTESACVSNGQNDIDLTVDTMSGGTELLTTLATGEVQDSNPLGVLTGFYQPILWTTQSVTNNVSGGAPTITQTTNYRCFGRWATDENSPVQPASTCNTIPGGKVFILSELQGQTANVPAQGYTLKYCKTSGTCTDVTSHFTAMTDTCATNSPCYAGGTPTQMTQLTTLNDVFSRGGSLEGTTIRTTSNEVPSFAITQNNYRLLGDAIQMPSDAATGDCYDFATVLAGGAEIDTYSGFARACVVNARGGGL